MRTLVMWDIDRTLLYAAGVASKAWQKAFGEVTGLDWRETPNFSGRTDLDICAEVFAVHGVTGCTPERFFEHYVREMRATKHLIGERGRLMPGVPDVLKRLDDHPGVVQTLVTGNVPAVAALKVAAFGLAGMFDAEVGGYGTDDAVRATLVRRSRERAEAKYGEEFHVVVVGDTVHDVTAALVNDARAVAVATGATAREELAAARAHLVLDDMSDVEKAVHGILGG